MFNKKQFILFSVAVYAVCAVDETDKGKAVQEENEANEALDGKTIDHHVIIRTPGVEDVNIFKLSTGFVVVDGEEFPGVNGVCDIVINFPNGENIRMKFGTSISTIVPNIFNQDNLDSGASTSSDVNLALEEVAIVFNGEKVPGCMIYGNKDIIIDRNADRLMINGKVVPGVTGQDVMVIDYNRGGGITVNGKRTEGFDDIKGVGSTILLRPN